MSRSNPRGLAFKLIMVLFTSVAVIFASSFLYTYSVSRQLMEKQLKASAEQLTVTSVLRIEHVLQGVQLVADNYARIAAASHGTPASLQELLTEEVSGNPDIFGAAIAFEPYGFDKTRRHYAPYVYRSGDRLATQDIGTPSYNYFTKEWYQAPRERQRAVWTEPYFDEGGGNVMMSTYAVPLYEPDGSGKRFIGVLTADVSLAGLQRYVNSLKFFRTGYAFVISANGTLVSHPNAKMVLNETIFSIAEKQKSSVLREIGLNMMQGKSSFAEFEYRNLQTGDLSWISYAPIAVNGWSIGIVIPVSEYMEDVTHLFITLLYIGVGGLTFLFAAIVLVARTVTSPLRRLTKAAELFALGDFSVALPTITSRDEIGTLNVSFIAMQSALESTIRDLKETSRQLALSNERLEDYNRTLEQRVDERTAELTAKNTELDAAIQKLTAAQAQLVQSEKMASLGQLTAGIAHEIKNPLNFVINFADLTVGLATELIEELDKSKAASGAVDEPYLREMIGDIQANAQKINHHGKRADSIVKGMLLHSRGAAGEKQPTDLNALLAEYVNLGYHAMRAQDKTFNLKIEADYDATLEPVSVVPQDLSRVFTNIVNNACYSTHAKKKELKDAYMPTLSVQTRNLPDTVEIRVRDNGKGIPQAVLDKVFNPFFTTKPAGQGTGLGLSLSYDIVVREHGGSLTALSQEGEYAEFVLVLPKRAA